MKTRKETLRRRTLLFARSMLGFTAADCTPIPGIEVRDDAYTPNTTATDAEGRYELKSHTAPLTVEYTFTDGEANGGDFAGQKVTVHFTEQDRMEKRKGWYQGSFARSGVDITLEERETEE